MSRKAPIRSDDRQRERRLATWTFCHSFGKGTATVFLETAASALFLVTFAAEWLPWVYVGAAVLTTLAGILYSRLERRFPFSWLILGTLVLLLAGTIAAQIGILVSSSGVVVFALLLFYRLTWFMMDLEYWAVATRLFDVRQGKRLFGLVGSGEVAARILGALAVPFLVAWIGVERLLGLSAIGLAASVVFVFLTFRAAENEKLTRRPTPPEPEPVGRRDRGVLLRIVEDRYLLLISIVVVFGVLGKYFVDYAFLHEMQNRYSEAEALAGVFGVFTGVTQLLNLLVRVTVSGRLLSRFGIGVGLLVLPVGHVLCTVAILVAGTVRSEDAMAIFWLALTNQALYKIFKHSIDSPAFKVLYQPLREDRRTAAQIAIDMIVNPLTTGFAGLVMLVAVPYRPVQFAGIMLVAFGLWVAFVVPTWREYTRALLRALRKRRIGSGEALVGDRESLALMEQRLESNHPDDVVFAVSFLERTDPKRLGRILVSLLRRPQPEIRRFALDRIHDLEIEEALPALRRLADASRAGALEAELEAPMLRAYASMEDEEHLAPWIDRIFGREDGGELVQRGLIVGLLGRPDGPVRERAAGQLATLVRSESAPSRRMAARALSELADERWSPLVLELLDDPVLDVRRGALAAAGKCWSDELWGPVVEGLASPALCSAATGTLVSAGEKVLPAVARGLADAELGISVRLRMARICGRISGDAAIEVLRSRLDEPDPRLRLQILLSLSICGYRARDLQPAEIREQLVEEAAAVRRRLSTTARLPPDGAIGVGLVHRALRHEADLARQRMLLLLSFLLEPRSLTAARENVGHPDPERRAYALEILDIALPPDLRFVLDCFELRPPVDRTGDGGESAVRTLLASPPDELTPWTRSCLCRAVRDLELGDLADEVRRQGALGPALVRETAAAALAHLDPTATGDPDMSMTTLEKVMILKSVSIFADTAEEILVEAAEALEEIEIDAGEPVFARGDHGNSMYIVISGRVRAHIGEKTLNEMGEREIFGEMAILDPEPRSASITAIDDTRLFRLDRDTFFELVADHVEIAAGTFRVICRRLRNATSF